MTLPERIEVPITVKDVDGEVYEIKRIVYVLEHTCRIITTRADSDYVDDWRYRCSECRCNIPVDERIQATGEIISAANYCPSCGAKVVA